MKILLISWVLLVLSVNLNSGHYIYKVEKADAPSYEVMSNLKGLVLVNTKLEKPTLKDILYQDLIERFFGKEEPLVTERAFTNSHGLPFLEELDDGSYDESLRSRNDESENDLEEESEPKPLTDEAVKEAYKSRSYLFDQMRQRNDAISPDLLERKKRQAETSYIPEAPQMPSDNSDRDPYAPNAPPKTYGMNLNPNGGYVWNNLNNPSSLYELGQSSNGYENPGQYQPPASSETPQPEEFTSSAAPEITPPEDFTSTTLNPDSDSSEDIYVNINNPTSQPSESSEDIYVNKERPREQPLENEKLPAIDTKDAILEETGESSTENPLVPNDNSDSNEPRQPTEPIIDETKPEQEGKDIEIPDTPVESVEPSSQESKPVDGMEPAPVQENPEEPEKEILPENSSTGAVTEIVLTTEGLAEINEGEPIKPNAEDQKEVEDILATAQPVEDIPKTYGMNLTSGTGTVWNDLVNPPVSYEVGTPENNQSEEPKETTTQTSINEEPVTGDGQTVELDKTEAPPTISEETVAPIDIPEVTETPENPSNEPEIKLPETEPEIEENNPTTELLKETTTETPYISESTEPAIQSPETEENNEEHNPTTELLDATSTTETSEIIQSTEPDVKLPETEAEDEEKNPNTEYPQITTTTQILDTVAPVTEPATEGINQYTDLPDVTSTTVEPEAISEENKPNDGNIEPVEPVTPAEEPENPEVEDPEPESGEPGDKVSVPEEGTTEDVTQKPDIMSELMKSEQFWKWLGEWTATYTELMEKHIRKIAIQEICNHSRQGVDMCPLDEPEDSGAIIKDGKVTINDKEIDVNDNIKHLKRNNPNKDSKVDATTIYGNSVGNDKVTNVFIFNPNNAKDILEGLKPDNDKVNIIIEDKNKEEIKGELVKPEVTTIPELEESEDIVEDAGIEDREAEIPKVEVVTEELKPIGDTDGIVPITEDAKGVRSVTEAVEQTDETTQIADVKEVTPDLSDLSKVVEKELQQTPELQ